MFNVKELIEPLMANLTESGLDENQTGYLDALGTFLADEVKPIDLNSVLARFENLLRRTIREYIDLKVIPASSLPVIKGDMGQLEQVIMNLAVNAQDAMPNVGSLNFETAAKELDEAYAALHEGVKPGPYVLLSVNDRG